VRQTDAPGIAPQVHGILEEHTRLRGYLDVVEAALCAPRTSETAVAWLGALATALGDLAPFLRAHFAREEEEGLFDRIQATWPHAAHACERLQREHGGLLAKLERLRAESEAGGLAEEASFALAAGVRSLLKDLARHEELENELLCGSLDDAVAAQD
jgi:iron-sulfur cluster repair protein YtfE (RIC family)